MAEYEVSETDMNTPPSSQRTGEYKRVVLLFFGGTGI
jgi:hypothetical protein